MTLIQLFNNIADAIRAKKGTTDKIKAENFAAEIESISGRENLDNELNEQDELLNNQNIGIQDIFDALENVGQEDKIVFTGHYDKEGLKQIGWSDEDIDFYQQNGVVWNEEDDDLLKLTEDELSGSAGNLTRFIPKNSTITTYSSYKNIIGIPYLDINFNSTQSIFSGCSSLKTISNLNLGNSETMNSMFNACYALRYLPKLDTSNIKTMYQTFYDCYSLTTIPEFNTSNVTDMSQMFYNCFLLKSIPMLDTSNVTDMSQMFYNCFSLNVIPKLNTGSVTNMRGMFTECNSLTTISMLDTKNVTNMSAMFSGCRSLVSIPQLDTGSAANMSLMFSACISLLGIPELDTGSATSMSNMFNNCNSLLIVPKLDTKNVTNMSYMFSGCSTLKAIPKLDASKVISISSMFSGCTVLTDLEGFENLGMAYDTTRAASYNNYTLTLSSSTVLTHDSIMNVINNLYDIATKGCKAQKLVLGTKNLAKISSEEKAIATAKGWTLS